MNNNLIENSNRKEILESSFQQNRDIELYNKFYGLKIKIDKSVLKVSDYYLNKVYDALERVFKEFPVLKGKLKYITLKESLKGIAGIRSINYKKNEYEMALNSQDWLSSKLESVLFNLYLRKKISTFTIEGTIYHEVSHSFEGIIGLKLSNNLNEDELHKNWNKHKTAKKLLKEAGFKMSDYKYISSYAGESPSEFFAEILSYKLEMEIYGKGDPSIIPFFIHQKTDKLYAIVQFYLKDSLS